MLAPLPKFPKSSPVPTQEETGPYLCHVRSLRVPPRRGVLTEQVTFVFSTEAIILFFLPINRACTISQTYVRTLLYPLFDRTCHVLFFDFERTLFISFKPIQKQRESGMVMCSLTQLWGVITSSEPHLGSFLATPTPLCPAGYGDSGVGVLAVQSNAPL